MTNRINRTVPKVEMLTTTTMKHDIWSTFWDYNIILHHITLNGYHLYLRSCACMWPLWTIILIRSPSLEINKILQRTLFWALCVVCVLIGILLLYDAPNSNLKYTIQIALMCYAHFTVMQTKQSIALDAYNWVELDAILHWH